MTTLDKRIPYYPVLMVLTQPPVITDIPLAQGYSFHPYEPSYKEHCMYRLVSWIAWRRADVILKKPSKLNQRSFSRI